MKNKLIYILLGLSTLGGVASCDVDTFPETQLSDGNFWNTTADLRMAANYFYSTLPGLTDSEVRQDVWSPYAYSNSGDQRNVSDGSRVTPASSGDYSYYNIFQANKLIEKSAEVLAKGASESEVNAYVAEARFFRAFYYFEMFKRFGGVPIITKTMNVNDPDIFAARATREEVFNFIMEDLDFASNNLKTADQINSAKEYGRISKSGALALKARIALFEGTRQKFHSYGNSTATLTIAKEAAETVINSGEHAIFSQPKTGSNGEILNDAYFNLFQEAGEGRVNKENIIVKAYGINQANSIISTPVQRYYEGSNVVPTQNFVDNYVMADGLPITKSPIYSAPNSTSTHASYFEKKDPRMGFTIFKRGDEFIQSSDYTIPNPRQHVSGYGVRKYANKAFWQIQASYIDRPVLRYAEVLLTYAETLFELNGSISDSDLDKTINALRARLPQVNIGTISGPNYVSLPKLTNAFVATNGLNMREEIRRERIVELGFEGHSYWDLIRWKTAETEMPKALKGSYLFNEFLTDSGEKWSSSIAVDANKHIILQDASLRKFDPEKDYLWPIPLDEIAKNPKIEQNPSW